MKLVNSIVLVTAWSAAVAGCKRKEEPAPAAAATAADHAPARDPNADFISVFATHAEPKPIDPVEVHINKFAVTKADFKDPKNLEGATAQLTLDLSSLQTDQPKRDKHLQSPDYLDVAQFATATIDIDNVHRKDDQKYTADADIKIHGVDKKLPVAFEVISTTGDSVRIKGEQAFVREDFAIGNNSTDPKVQSVAQPLTIKLQLTLAKTP
jgi:polyisoprenoid-binding protein YceI